MLKITLFDMVKNTSLYLLIMMSVVGVLPACWSKQKKSGLLVVNVLSEALYDDCHIKGSMNVPFEELDSFYDTIDEDAQVVFYCSNYMCSSSGYAAKKLKSKGFKHVWAYEGGTAEWFQAGLPVEGPSKQPYLRKKMDPVDQGPDVPVITTQELAQKMGYLTIGDE